MEKLLKTLQELKKYFNMAIKPPKINTTPSNPNPSIMPKAVSAAPKSKKDPAKVAAQLKGDKAKKNPFKPESVSFNKSGQWKIY